MNDYEYFSLDGKKVLIADSFNHADQLAKRYVLTCKKPILDFERVTLDSLAENIFKIKCDGEIISDNDAVFIVDYLIRKNNYDFIPKESFALSTSKAFYDAIKEIKYGQIVKENSRYQEVKQLFDDYQQYLEDRNIYDGGDVIKIATNLISKDLLAWGDNVIIGVTDNLKHKLRFIELELLNKILSIYQQEANYILYNYSNQYPHNIKVDAHGFINEIKYIVDDIRKNNINFSDIDIYTSDSSYDMTIKSLFDYYNISYSFIQGESATTLSIISNIHYAFEFVQNMCDLRDIYNILLTDSIKDEFKQLIPHLSKLKCDHYNIKQYPLEDENLKQFIDLLLNIDDRDIDISSLYSRVIDFISFITKEEDYLPFKETLENLNKHLVYVDNISCPTINEKIDILLSLINNIKISKEKEGAYVRIRNLSSGFVLTRKHNYFVGLSASQMTVKEIQSPVLNDIQLMELLNTNAYIHLAKNNNSEYMERINELLATASSDMVNTYIYSSYDSIEFKQQAPSTLYIDIIGEEKLADYELDEGRIPEITNKNNNGAKDIQSFNFSPSALADYAECPCKFILQYVEDYGKVDLAQYSNRWLLGGEFGTLCHLILEKYFKANNTKEKQKDFNEESFIQCVSDAKKETLKNIPYGNFAAVEIDSKKAEKTCKNYLKTFFEENDGWVVAAYEYRFKSEDAAETFEIDNANVVVNYHGTIDRIDVKVDDEGHFYVRTIDYKTNRSKIISKIGKGLTYQDHIYSIAVKSYCLKNKKYLERLLGQKLNYEKAEDLDPIFQYAFIQEEGKKQIAQIDTEDYAKASVKLKALIKSLLLYNQHHDLDESLDVLELMLDRENDQFKSNCQYCSFTKHCRYKIYEGEQMYPKPIPKGKDNE